MVKNTNATTINKCNGINKRQKIKIFTKYACQNSVTMETSSNGNNEMSNQIVARKFWGIVTMFGGFSFKQKCLPTSSCSPESTHLYT